MGHSSMGRLPIACITPTGSCTVWMNQNRKFLDDEIQNEVQGLLYENTVLNGTVATIPRPRVEEIGESRANRNPVLTWVQTNVFNGIEITPEIIAITTIYFVEGALGLARLAKTYLLKDELHLGPAELAALTGVFALPWTVKPLYGFLSDGFPLFGYKRKSYLVAAGVLGAISYSLLGFAGLWEGISSTTAVTSTVTLMVISSACIAMADVVADGIVVTRTRESTDPAVAGGLQSLCWGASALGGLLAAYFSGSLLEIMSVREVFGLAAILPFIVALIAFVTDEQPLTEDDKADDVIQSVKDQVNSVWEALRQQAIWRPVLFLFLWQATPTSDGAFFFFLSNDLGLGPEFMGRIRLVTSAASLVGVWLYNRYLKTVEIKDMLFWSTIASFPLGLIPILLITHVNRSMGIPDSALIYGDDVVLAVLGQISFMPTLVLAARLCPPVSRRCYLPLSCLPSMQPQLLVPN